MTEPNVEVGIVKNKKIHLYLKGNYFDKKTKKVFSGNISIYIHGKKIVLKTTKNTYEYNENIEIHPKNIEENISEVKNVVIGIGFHWEQEELQKFQGSLKFIILNGEVQLINILPIEKYLYSVISSEMRGDSSLNLLKTHAVISRSWLLAQIKKQKTIENKKVNYKLVRETKEEYIRWYDREDHEEYHVCADDHCQRYQGVTRAYNTNVIEAINDTRGEVLISVGEIADARFSKCCGGITEKFENCWEPEPHSYLQSFIDFSNDSELIDFSQENNVEKYIVGSPKAYCNTSDKKVLSQVLNDYDHASISNFYRWKIEYTQQEISKLINSKSGFDFGEIKELIPVERGASSRLIRLKIVGTKQTKIIGKELEIRRILSDTHLYSSAIVIEKSMITDNIPQKFTIKGAGWGHGVGLCQIGAAVMGEKGFGYKEILNHYFRGAELKKIY